MSTAVINESSFVSGASHPFKKNAVKRDALCKGNALLLRTCASRQARPNGQ
jgi:hypothetical protein